MNKLINGQTNYSFEIFDSFKNICSKRVYIYTQNIHTQYIICTKKYMNIYTKGSISGTCWTEPNK